MINAVRRYALVQEHEPDRLVASVTHALQAGYVLAGGVSVAHEPAKPAKGIAAARTIYCQALVLLHNPNDHLGIIKEPKVDGLIVNGREPETPGAHD